MKSYISKDGDFVLVKVPKNDMDSLVRFIAHAIEKNPDKVLKLSKDIVLGDLTKQDKYVKELIKLFDVSDWSLVFNKQDSLDLCDDLADAVYENLPIHMGTFFEPKKERHLKVVKVCVDCQKGYIKNEPHRCEVK